MSTPKADKPHIGDSLKKEQTAPGDIPESVKAKGAVLGNWYWFILFANFLGLTLSLTLSRTDPFTDPFTFKFSRMAINFAGHVASLDFPKLPCSR